MLRARATASPAGGAWPPGAYVEFSWGDRSEPSQAGPPGYSAAHWFAGARTYRIRAQAFTRGGAMIGGPAFTTFNAAAPTLLAIAPPGGTSAGGTPCTITGANLGTPAAIVFGGTPATNLQGISTTTITCTSPAGTPGALVNVQAVAPVGTNAVQYQYADDGTRQRRGRTT
jgi:IPT/TIG domain